MSAETTFYNNLGDAVFEASGMNRYDLFKRVKNEHSAEIHAIFEEFNIEESGEAEKDVRAWWEAAYPNGYIDTIEEDAPPPSDIIVILSKTGELLVVPRTSVFDVMMKEHEKAVDFRWNGSEWEAK